MATRAFNITTESSTESLYALILASESVTQLPQRTDLGAVIFPDFVAEVVFTNTTNPIVIMDQNGNILIDTNNSVAPPFIIGAGNINCISLQSLFVQGEFPSTIEGYVVQV